MVLHHFEYTAEMCDCRYCPYYRGKRKCTASQCPCIEERIVAGAASRAEVMAETMRDIHNGAFRRRLNQFIKEREELHMNFRNEKHRLAFVEAIRKLDKKNFALMSALYLLTAEHKYIFFFNLNVTLIANPLLCAFASCVLQAMHRIAAGWADNWDFQQVDSRLPIRTCLCVTRCLSAPQSLKRCFVNDLWIGGISKVSVIIHDPHNPGFIPCDNTRGELHFV